MAHNRKFSPRITKSFANRAFHGLTIVLSGKLSVIYPDKEYVACRGDIILQRRGDSYTLKAGDEETQYIVISYLAEPETFPEGLLPEDRVFHSERSHRYIDDFKKVCDIGSGLCSIPLLRASVQQIICNIAREYYRQELFLSGDYIFSACCYIEENLHLPITSADISRAAACSPTHLRRLFKSTLNESPVRYLNRMRIEHAKKLLTTDLFTMEEIAAECGFSNVYYFSRVFKEFTGISPGKY